MGERDEELISILEEVRPYKDIIIVIMEKRIRQLEFEAFRYGPKPSSWGNKSSHGRNKGEEYYDKVIETRKIKNLLIALFSTRGSYEE